MVSSYGNILNVSQDAEFKEMAESSLEDGGFSVQSVNSFNAACEAIEKSIPDIVISELHDKKSRHELMQWVKQKAPEMPIVIVLNEKDGDALVEAIREGAWDFVLTPLKHSAQLEQVVCRALERCRLVIENKNYKVLLEEKNKMLSKHLKELEADQKAGKILQEQLMPEANKKIGAYTLNYEMLPSLYLSGDYIDYFEIDMKRIGFYIADVSGHGASSAFVTVLLKSIVDQLLEKHLTQNDKTILNPDHVLETISNVIWESKLGKYLTMVFGIIDCEKNELAYSLGGHYPSPIMNDGNGSKFLPGGGFAVGIIKDLSFNAKTIKLPKQFSLLLCSDGIMEVLAGEKLEKKEEQLLNSLSSTQCQLADIKLALGLKDDENAPDDISFLMIKREVA